MDANPEVMPVAGSPAPRQEPVSAQAPRNRQEVARQSLAANGASESRLSEDPMRRTDRYRLVMPYSLRV
jgi:hypothetical protein